MAIPQDVRNNFNTILRAASHGRLALMECTRVSDGSVVNVICAVSDDPAGLSDNVVFVPFAEMAEGNPFEAYVPAPQIGDPSGDTDMIETSPSLAYELGHTNTLPDGAEPGDYVAVGKRCG